MMSSNKISAGLMKGVPQEKDRAIKLIVAFTGENPNKLAKHTMDELLQYLSFILKCDKEKAQELLRSHDQNQEIDEVSLKALWKLVSKGAITAKEHDFATLSKKTYEQLKFLMAGLSRIAMIRAENSLGSGSSTVTIQDLRRTTTLDPKKPMISLDDIKKTHAFQLLMSSGKSGPNLNKLN